MVSTTSAVAAALGVAIFGTLYLALAQAGDAAIAVNALMWAAAALGTAALLSAVAAHRAARPDDTGHRVAGISLRSTTSCGGCSRPRAGTTAAAPRRDGRTGSLGHVAVSCRR